MLIMLTTRVKRKDETEKEGVGGSERDKEGEKEIHYNS